VKSLADGAGHTLLKKVSIGTRQRRRWKCLEDARSDAR
jgi:hypothetical protein